MVNKNIHQVVLKNINNKYYLSCVYDNQIPGKNLQTLSKLRCITVYVHNFDLSMDCRWNVLLLNHKLCWTMLKAEEQLCEPQFSIHISTVLNKSAFVLIYRLNSVNETNSFWYVHLCLIINWQILQRYMSHLKTMVVTNNWTV